MKNLYSLKYFLIIFLAVFLCACKDEDPEVLQTNYVYQKPADLSDGIAVSDLETEGLDSMSVKILMDSIDEGVYGIFHSILIFKNDKLVLEEYRNGWQENDLNPMYSVTKSIASAVLGITIDKGYIPGTDETIYNLLSVFNQVNWTDEKKLISLKDLLTMSSGYQWDEFGTSYDDPENPHYQMIASDDWIKYLIELPLSIEPGTKFNYNTGTSTLFSVFATEATGINFDNFTTDNLLSKIDIQEYSWYYMPGNYPATGGSYGGLHLKARDMAKFGLLYLNNGMWKEERIISEAWINESLSPHINITQSGSFTYGYQWWRNEQVTGKNGEIIAVPYAVGSGGQYIFLIYDYDILITITAPFNNPDRTTTSIFEMIEDYILAAVK